MNQPTKRMTVDLNSDLGESYGAYVIGRDEDLLKRVSSANIACGFHAGDPSVMRRTVRLCLEHGVAIGAHPGLPDLQGFGRREMRITPDEAYGMTLYQIGALDAIVRAEGGQLRHVKPHGALYNMAARDRRLADAIAEAVARFDTGLVLFGLSGSELLRAGQARGLATASEVFADRRYLADGTLVPRSQPEAVLHEEAEAVAQVLRMVREGTAVASDGSAVTIQADTVCLHGDSPHAAAFAVRLRSELESAGIGVHCVAGLSQGS
ncbi:5-oxoprolinase subunit PxpA [Gorillibacterium sp. sgz5001074]|uniref:5-oxoprolinase subunit PxpA n=1 Tax=Gorillibacterium sp. sgz5001074 TaxID=3446695 RepID=UPI003F67BF86